MEARRPGIGFNYLREKLVDSLKERGYIIKPEVVDALMTVPRHDFMPDFNRNMAYIDSPQQIGRGQTISAPHMVGIMLEALDLLPGQRVLEIGGGSGYHAACAAEIVGKKGQVYSVEIIEKLALGAQEMLQRTGYDERVTVVMGDGSRGYARGAPFDRIWVAAAAPEIPPQLTGQLMVGGKLLIPVGSRFQQELILVRKEKDRLYKESRGGCVFVPLVGDYGFGRK